MIYPALPGKISKGMIVKKLTKFPFLDPSREMSANMKHSCRQHCLDLIYMPTKYNQNFSEGIKAME